MAEKVASLYVDIGADTSKLESGLNRTKTGLNDAAKQAGGMGAALKTALTNAAVIAGVNALVSGIKYMVAQAMEAETVMRATEATIKATGGAAGYTAEQIADLAGAESRLTSIDDEVIQSGLNMLLTFKQIGGETLPRATRAMEDMAVAMANGDTSAIDLQGTAIQLGKALNDPIAGVTALRRVGVTLSEQQQQQIKDFMAVNDIASAQAIILGELESEFGGMAEAMGGTSAGKIEKAKNALNNLAAAIGDDLTPVIANAAQAFADLLTAHERVQRALEEHEKEVKQTAGSYEDYQREIYRMVAASTGLTDVNKFVNLSLDVQAEKVARLAPDLEIMTQAEWDAANAAAEMSDRLGASASGFGLAAEGALDASDALVDFSDKISSLEEAMKGAIGEELTEWREKQGEISDEIADTRDEISKLEALKYLTPEQKEDLEAAREKLSDLGESAKQANIDHHEAMVGIIYDMAQVRAAADGIITEAEYNALKDYATNMGTVDQATVDAQYALQLMQDKLATSPSYYENYSRALETMTSALDDGSISAGELERILGILTGQDWSVNVGVHVDDQDMHDLQNYAMNYGGGNQQQPLARAIGGSVKAGYPVKWQEVGGEVMVPERDGTILSHGDLMRMINALSAGGGNARGNQTVNFYGYQQPEQIAGRLSVLEAFGV